jgi:hypothetical protein
VHRGVRPEVLEVLPLAEDPVLRRVFPRGRQAAPEDLRGLAGVRQAVCLGVYKRQTRG